MFDSIACYFYLSLSWYSVFRRVLLSCCTNVAQNFCQLAWPIKDSIYDFNDFNDINWKCSRIRKFGWNTNKTRHRICYLILSRFYKLFKGPNAERPHSGRYCYGKTPMETLAESKHLAKDKELDNQKWWAFDANNRTDSTVGNNLTVR